VEFFAEMNRIIVVFLACFCVNVIQASAQNTVFSGRVIDANARPLANVHVLLDGGEYYDVTNSEGHFEIKGISFGTYSLTVQRIGFGSYNKKITIDESGIRNFKVTLRSKRYRFKTVVVTATRGRRLVEEVPVPVTVIEKEEISRTGATRLSEVLAEQTGLRLTSDHGTGIQVQGFSSEYTLIMLNGQPLIGRPAGTLDLSRISVGNIKQIEMIKGPSSALWGSQALAGVINIITQTATEPFSATITSRYGTNNNLDLGTNLSWQYGNWQNHLFINRNSSGGYRLNSGSVSPTVPGFHNYTASYRTGITLSDWISLDFYGRYFREQYESQSFIDEDETRVFLNDEGLRQDYSINPSLTIDFTKGAKLEVSHFISSYRTERTLAYQEGGSLYQQTIFDQSYHKSDAQFTMAWNARQITTTGAGLTQQGLTSGHYAGTPSFRNFFLYGQHEWMPFEKLDIIVGFRYDTHNEYGSQLSPKLSARYKINEWLHIRASAGSGFKAPDFRQLFLNFTNPTVGYSVFGSIGAAQRVRELQEQGKISRILVPLDQLEAITAEQSWAYNLGFDLYPAENLQFRVNFFRNDVNDMIETAPIATKVNGQSVFSYFNLTQIYTQGIEAQMRWEPYNGLGLSLGYQLLDAERLIKETRTVQDEQGDIFEKTFSSYEPLLNRSAQSGNIKVFYEYEPYGLQASIRGTFEGKYGFGDSNGNGYADPEEYVGGYSLWDMTVSKSFNEKFRLQTGIENIFDFTRPGSLSYLPGRLFYLQLSLQL
jgi:outer membrane receptor for ferrienterochelin and colicins